MCPSPLSPPPRLQIKSQDLFQSWVAQLRAHRLAPRLDVPRGPLPSNSHRKVRWALGQEPWGVSVVRPREVGTSFLTLDSPHRVPGPSSPQ